MNLKLEIVNSVLKDRNVLSGKIWTLFLFILLAALGTTQMNINN